MLESVHHQADLSCGFGGLMCCIIADDALRSSYIGPMVCPPRVNGVEQRCVHIGSMVWSDGVLCVYAHVATCRVNGMECISVMCLEIPVYTHTCLVSRLMCDSVTPVHIKGGVYTTL